MHLFVGLRYAVRIATMGRPYFVHYAIASIGQRYAVHMCLCLRVDVVSHISVDGARAARFAVRG